MASGSDLDAFVRREVAPRIPTLQSIVIGAPDGPVYAHHAAGAAPNRPANVKSITKSVVSAVVGVLLRDLLLDSVDRRVSDLLPEAFTRRIERSKHAITVEHLLTMTSGLDWLENGHMVRYWLESPDPTAFTLRLPLFHTPGTVFKYSNFAAHLLSAIVTRLTGNTLAAFAERHLFAPLGLAAAGWPALADGFSDGASNLQLRPEDLARFGCLYLDDGRWKGAELIPRQFVASSTRRHVEGNHPEHTAYGYLWWVQEHGPARGYFASGYGGQRIHVLPKLRRVIVITADPEVPRDRLPDVGGAVHSLAGFLGGD